MSATTTPTAAPDVATTSAVPDFLQRGILLTKISEKSRKRLLFRIDPDEGLILYPSNKNGLVPIECIKEIRTGPDAESYCMQFRHPRDQWDRWITIVYVLKNTFKTLHLVADTNGDLVIWQTAVRGLFDVRRGLMKGVDNSELRRSVWERQYWKGADKSGDKTLDLNEIKAMAVRLNINYPKGELEKLFNQVDTTHQNKLNYVQFQQFVKLLKRRPEIEALFKRMAGEKKLDHAGFEKFMKETQKSVLSASELEAVFEKYSTPAEEPPTSPDVSPTSPSAMPHSARLMSLDQFENFLISEDNAVTRPEINDMARPLSEYFISTSHNTYLVGNQLMGVSTVEGYIRALLCACRSVELDIYDGPTAPVVYHGNTLTSAVSVQEICEAIAKYAFVSSPYPVMLSCEIHCGLKQQDMLVDIMLKAFGTSLIKLSPNEKIEIKALPSPDDLKGKIMVKTKNLYLATQLESVKEHQKAAEMAAAKAAHLPVEDSSSDSESEEEQSEAQLVMEEIGAGINAEMSDLKSGISDLKSRWKKMKSAATGKPQKPKLPKVPMSMALASLLVYTVGVKYRGIKQSEIYAPEQIFSLSESQINKFLKDEQELESLVRHTQTHVVRIYPKGTRIDSTNYEPVQYWAAGCQLVALNIQTMDLGFRLNQAMFMRCGHQGYVLKPPALRDPEFKQLQIHTKHFFDVTIISAQQLPRAKDSSGKESDEKSIIDPYVEVVLHIPAWSTDPFLPKDKKFKHVDPADSNNESALHRLSYSTEPVKNNGFNPMWQEEFCLPFDCIGGLKELVFVEFIVKQAKQKASTEPLASYMAPLSSLEHGFRHLPLHDGQLTQYLFATLFVNINVRDVE